MIFAPVNILYIAARKGLFACLALLCLITSGCGETKPASVSIQKPVLVRVAETALPIFADDMVYDSLVHGIRKSLLYLDRIPSGTFFRFGEDLYGVAHMKRSLSLFASYIQETPSQEELRRFVADKYRVYQSVGSNGKGRMLFTGYYEPLLEGRLERNEEFRFPIYARPKNLAAIDLSLFSPDLAGRQIVGRYVDQRIVPYFDREQITYGNALAGTTEVLAWVKDPIDLFFLEIQGSGKLFIDNHGWINVHYHTSNGRPYRSIGKLLLEEGKIPKARMSMQSIRDYLLHHPEDVRRILAYNPSYVFFKTEKEGPLGSLNVTLTPGRSLALDRRIFPKGALGFIETQEPLIDGDGSLHRWTKLHRFILIQDTGGAIRGAGRGDLFWGNGPYAEIAAGHMQHEGKLYLLVLKPES